MKLQFTNGYRPRFDQISRIMQFLHSQDEQKKNIKKDIVTVLGIPNSQAENLISIMTGFGLVHPNVTTLTQFGKAVVQKDPYFEKVATLWIIHYIVSSNPEWVVWHRIVNFIMPNHDKLSVEEICEKYFLDLVIHYSVNTISKKLPKEVGSTLASYTRTELSRLHILDQEKTGTFLRSNPVEIPAVAFLFCMLYYRDKHSPGSSAINTEDICIAEDSPGRVFNIPDFQVRSMLGELHDNGLVRLEQFANLNQVRLPETITQESTLSRIYGV